MPTTAPHASRSGFPAEAALGAGEDVMAAFPLAGPLAMAVPTDVTEPDVGMVSAT